MLTAHEVHRRHAEGSPTYSKLLPRLLRLTAAELRRRGWEPLALLCSLPDEPLHEGDASAGGVEGERPGRRRWLHTPEREIELLTAEIERREKSKHSAAWHHERRGLLAKAVISSLEAELSELEKK